MYDVQLWNGYSKTLKHSWPYSILRSEFPTHFLLPIIHYPSPRLEGPSRDTQDKPYMRNFGSSWIDLIKLTNISHWILLPYVCSSPCLCVFISVPMKLVWKQWWSWNNRSAGAHRRVNRCQRLLRARTLCFHSRILCSALLSICSTLPGHSAPVRLCSHPSLTFN